MERKSWITPLAAMFLLPLLGYSDASAATTITCGPMVTSTVITETFGTGTTSSSIFLDVPGAATLVNVPAGATRCIKVLLTGRASCNPVATSGCYVRVLDNGAEMNPVGSRAFITNDGSVEARAYQWAVRVGSGNHQIKLQRRVNINGSVFFRLDQWSFNVEVFR